PFVNKRLCHSFRLTQVAAPRGGNAAEILPSSTALETARGVLPAELRYILYEISHDLILVVDDDAAMRDTIVDVLERPLRRSCCTGRTRGARPPPEGSSITPAPSFTARLVASSTGDFHRRLDFVAPAPGRAPEVASGEDLPPGPSDGCFSIARDDVAVRENHALEVPSEDALHAVPHLRLVAPGKPVLGCRA